MKTKISTFFNKHWMILALLLVPLFGTHVLMMNAPLVYGDVAALNVHQPMPNPASVWDDEAFGTNIRQSLGGFRNIFLADVAPNAASYFILQQLLPLILIPVTFYFFLRASGVRDKWVRLVGAIFALINPVVFGDLLNGQTFWIYIILPWVYYYATKIFVKRLFSIRNSILLGLLLTMAMGALPPIIVPLCIVIVLYVLISFIVIRLDVSIILKCCSYGLVVLVTFITTSLPYLLVASDGQESYVPNSNSIIADYRHNYGRTDLLNVFRLAGNDGNGQNTLGFNDLSLSNSLGYVMFMLLVIGMLSFSNQIKDKAEVAERQQILILGIVCLLVLGGLHILATNTGLGSELFTTQWLFSTIRNPTKVFVLVLPLYVLGVAYGLSRLSSLGAKTVAYPAILTVFLLSVLAYGWPYFRGDMGLTYSKQSGLTQYKPLDSVQHLASTTNRSLRSLLVSANHRDELNYQESSSGLNMLRLGGALPRTTNYIKELNSSFNNRTPYFFDYLSNAGINEVVVKKEPQQNSQFGLFPTTLSQGESKSFLGSKLGIKTEDQNYTVFKNDSAKQLFYSPTNIASVAGESSIYKLAPLMRAKKTVVDTKNNYNFVDDYYSSVHGDASKSKTEGYAQTFDPALVTIQYYSVGVEPSRQLKIDQVNSLNGTVFSSHSYVMPANVQIFSIDGEHYAINSARQTAYIRSGDKKLSFYTLTKEPLSRQFEGEDNPVGDASKTRSGSSEVYGAKVSNDATEGKQSYLLGSKNHLAYFEKKIKLKAGSEYQLGFDYKNLSGEAPSYNIVEDNAYIQFSNGNLDKESQWKQYETYIKPNKSGLITVNFYTDSLAQQKSENLFDRLEVYRLDERMSQNLSIDQTAPDDKITNIDLKTALKPEETLIDSEFEDGQSWGTPSDASPTAKGKASITSVISHDAKQGSKSLSLESRNHTAFIAKKAVGFKPNRVYKLSFWYKNEQGNAPSYAVWQSGTNKASPAASLGSQTVGWQYYETTFAAIEGATNMTLYLYSASQGETTVNLFDDVTLSLQSPISNFLTLNKVSTEMPTQLVKDFKKVSDAKYVVDLNQGSGLVVFNQSFTKNWSAALQDATTGKTTPNLSSRHVVVNGFANGWIIDNNNKNTRLVLSYTPQVRFTKLLRLSLMIMAVCIILVFGSYVYGYAKTKKAYRLRH